jgi:hypothetical protein
MCYLNRTYHVLPTFDWFRLDRGDLAAYRIGSGPEMGITSG